MKTRRKKRGLTTRIEHQSIVSELRDIFQIQKFTEALAQCMNINFTNFIRMNVRNFQNTAEKKNTEKGNGSYQSIQNQNDFIFINNNTGS